MLYFQAELEDSMSKIDEVALRSLFKELRRIGDEGPTAEEICSRGCERRKRATLRDPDRGRDGGTARVPEFILGDLSFDQTLPRRDRGSGRRRRSGKSRAAISIRAG